jgi:hypothetical protein
MLLVRNIKIYPWSQMHEMKDNNKSVGLILNLLHSKSDLANRLLEGVLLFAPYA